MVTKAARNIRVVCFAVLVVACEDATAQSHVKLSAAETCLEINREISLGVLLSRTKARLNATGSLKIVAVGSSSTSGLWVLNPAATFPEIMRQELRLLRPKVQIEIVNSGRIGDTISGAINRFERDVLRYDPDLVVWQLGTNDVAWGGNAHGLKDLVIAGVRILKASRADVILMDLQYTPMVRASSGHLLMQSIIAEAARVERVGLFSRFELMRRTIEAGLPPDALVSWDGLHNSLAGYECVGRALARAVSAALR